MFFMSTLSIQPAHIGISIDVHFVLLFCVVLLPIAFAGIILPSSRSPGTVQRLPPVFIRSTERLIASLAQGHGTKFEGKHPAIKRVPLTDDGDFGLTDVN